MSYDLVRKAATQAEMLAADGKVPVAVPYHTPQERANATLKRNLVSGAAAVAVAIIPGTLVFLQTGDFSSNALRTFGISALTALLMLVLNWATKLQSAKSDDAASYPGEAGVDLVVARAAAKRAVSHPNAPRTLDRDHEEM